MDDWKTIFLLERPIFRGHVSFREGIYYLYILQLFSENRSPSRCFVVDLRCPGNTSNPLQAMWEEECRLGNPGPNNDLSITRTMDTPMDLSWCMKIPHSRFQISWCLLSGPFQQRNAYKNINPTTLPPQSPIAAKPTLKIRPKPYLGFGKS